MDEISSKFQNVCFNSGKYNYPIVPHLCDENILNTLDVFVSTLFYIYNYKLFIYDFKSKNLTYFLNIYFFQK